jgi:predicted phosphoribosyltransferase
METVTEITLKDKIHFAISDIEDEKLLETIYTILEYSNLQKEQFEDAPNDKILEELNRRRERYLSGEDKGMTIEEYKAKIFAKYGF